MTRQSLLCGSAFLITITTVAALSTVGVRPHAIAAPVPLHLMAKTPPPSFPTDVGTEWVYTNGTVDRKLTIAEVRRRENIVSLSITSADVGGGNRTNQCWSLGPDGFLLGEGAPFLMDENRAAGRPWCLMKFPSKLGDEWKGIAFLEGVGTITGKLRVAATEVVKVPSGTFTATRVEWVQANTDPWMLPTRVYWYAAGVGVVRVDDPPQWSLKSFRLGGE